MDQVQVGKASQECEFEIVPFATQLHGEMKCTVYERGGQAPVGIISSDQAWFVRVEWRLTGGLVHHLCGTFCVCLHLECFGPGLEGTLQCIDVPMDPCKEDGEWYKVDIEVPAGYVKPHEDTKCGEVCCIVVTLTSLDPCGNRGHIAAYCKGPCIMFYPATQEPE